MPKPLTVLLALSLSSIFFSKTSKGTDTISSNCFSHECGGVKINYPFWLMKNTTSNQLCGYQGFNLTCSKEEIPIIDLSGVSYFVKNISYTDFTLTLVEVAVTTNQTCPRARHNVTIQTLPLSYNKSDLFLSFYFNCSALGAAANSVECLSSDGNESYVFVAGTELGAFDQWYDSCEEKVHLIVMDSAIDQTNGLVGGFGEALKEGFVLEPACRACEASEGRCGYNINEGSLCFCSDEVMRMNDSTCKGSAVEAGYSEFLS